MSGEHGHDGDGGAPPGEDWLNYHHLHYFWRIAREGFLSRAAARLNLITPRPVWGTPP